MSVEKLEALLDRVQRNRAKPRSGVTPIDRNLKDSPLQQAVERQLAPEPAPKKSTPAARPDIRNAGSRPRRPTPGASLAAGVEVIRPPGRSRPPQAPTSPPASPAVPSRPSTAAAPPARPVAKPTPLSTPAAEVASAGAAEPEKVRAGSIAPPSEPIVKTVDVPSSVHRPATFGDLLARALDLKP
ncbi:MAG: hypothetical protein AAGF12_26675 [Myxococcota bacterium]